MRITVKLIKILGLFCFVLLSTQAIAAQFALVVSDRAVIYADQSMTAPIGYLTKGKKLKVGEVARHRGQLLPVIISKKIAYVRIDDLALSYDPERLDLIAERKSRKDKKVEQYQFSVHLDSQKTVMTTSDTIGGDKSKSMNFTGTTIRGHIGKFRSREDFRVGLEYASGSDGDDEYLRMFSIFPELFFSFNRSEKWHLGLITSLYFTPYAQYELSPLFKVNGQGYGFALGPSVNFNLTPKMRGEVSWVYRSTSLSGYNLPDGISINTISPKLNGTMFSLGLSYLY